ncbi:TPA: restriction endonuclease [Corynebacterium striatum]|nr:restriction endonuclease [Corynebacterium striatum]HAT1390572.1 restriction endonuclease [Corynebacterium striatum]
MIAKIQPETISIQLAAAFKKQDPTGERLGRVFRESFDQIYDGQHTGRFAISQLSKTESAHLGSIVEINIRREFDGFIGDGEVMDFDIEGFEVDCKYSKQKFGWMIPIEALGHHGMLCHADDEQGTFRVGFALLDDSILTRGGNRDGKRSISAAGRSAIQWLFLDEAFPPNTLLQLSEEDRAKIFSSGSGAQRLNELFRIAQGIIVPRGIIATVAQQKDYMKRIRYNGGSRSALQPEGIVILGDYLKHQKIASELGLPIPKDGDSLSTRLVKCEKSFEGSKTYIDDSYWRIATPTHEVEPAPTLPFK